MRLPPILARVSQPGALDQHMIVREWEARLQPEDDGFRQDGLQDDHGLGIVLYGTVHKAVHPGGIVFHAQMGTDAGQQLSTLDWLAAVPGSRV